VQGAGHPAIWEPPLLLDLSRGLRTVDVGTHTVEESRPFTLRGELLFDETWLANPANRKQDLRAEVSADGALSLPEGVRRTPLGTRTVEFDRERGSYHCRIETPMTAVRLRFQLEGYADLLFTVEPQALETWSRAIRIPGDFSP